jgi:hypothetical protein
MYERDEVESAFRNYWMVGPVNEDWAAWASLFTDDAVYVEHFWGMFHGPAEIQEWMESVMAAVPHIFSVLKWYIIDDGRVVYEVMNRADHPEVGGDPFEFASIGIVDYAGDGRWSREEDWWYLPEARRFAKGYADACARFDPEHSQKMTRRTWGPWVDWARPDSDEHPVPSWVGRTGLRPALRPEHLSVGIRSA